MTSYCVFTADRRPLADPAAIVLVPDGFSWPAALVSVPWALGQRLWQAALALAAIQLVIAALPALAGLEPATAGALLVAVAVATGAHAADLRTRSLRRRGYRVDGLVVAAAHEDALRRYLTERRLVVA